ncbi:transcriptional regulator [Oceanococcus atlanticus]|uniref:Transcriptional regulator n=1 Tax=Oceanococcus atlanticus TaxID=1317117 RepID=A0A1Y1SEE1_9GAMM|nr:HTH-type transcriptional repressor FabR [Oceanococcus atlanticus]ORE87365.1 transcriptional regulator [Oceanococcus atlanticus]
MPASSHHRGKQHINRQDLLDAALRLLGPNRSVSTLGLREVARAADIAPNSFYRHFRDIDELAVALIEQAGGALRTIIREARNRVSNDRSAVVSSVETFMEQLEADEKYLHLLLREGSAGSTAFKQAIERQLQYFETELQEDLVRLSSAAGRPLSRPDLVSKAITRMIFALGGTAMDQNSDQREQTAQQMIIIIRMIIAGSLILPRQHAGL